MPVYQTNMWVCEKCHKITTTSEETFPWSDPVVQPPNDECWDYFDIEGKELLLCPNCITEIQTHD